MGRHTEENGRNWWLGALAIVVALLFWQFVAVFVIHDHNDLFAFQQTGNLRIRCALLRNPATADDKNHHFDFCQMDPAELFMLDRRIQTGTVKNPAAAIVVVNFL